MRELSSFDKVFGGIIYANLDPISGEAHKQILRGSKEFQALRRRFNKMEVGLRQGWCHVCEDDDNEENQNSHFDWCVYQIAKSALEEK